MATRNFHNSNKKTKYGEHDVKFWIGTVAGYASQEKQLENGFGWMYKVRIDGDHSSNKAKVKDEQLSYAYCILPTTAGSGAAFKLRSARISQGDTVFGVRGGGVGAPSFIIGVFPRTRETVFATTTEIENGTKSGGLTGFYGSLKKNKTLSGEFNDQIGPATPGTDPIGPKNYNKAIAKEPSKQVEQLGINPNDNKPVENVEELLTPPVTDANKKWTPVGVTTTTSNVETSNVGTNIEQTNNLNAEPIANSQIKKLLTNTSAEEVVAVVDGITPKYERDIDPTTGLYFGQSAHQYQGGVAEYWKKIESQRELTEREIRYKKKNKDQYGRSLENESQQFKFVDGFEYERVKAENGTYVYESPKPAVTYKREYKQYVNAAIDQGIRQNLIDSDVARKAQYLVGSGDFEGALNLLYPPPPPTTT